MKLINPEKEFEADPEYWDLQVQLAEIAHLKELNSKKAELERTKQIVSQEEAKLKEMKGE